LKKCNKCGIEKEREEFHKSVVNKDGLRFECKDCRKQYRLEHKEEIKKYYLEHKEKIRQYSKQYGLEHREKVVDRDYRRLYGITALERNQMLVWQGYRCAICRVKENGKKLHVDHNHKTKQIRMLLCGSCNRGTKMTDNPKLLRAKAEYIEAYS